MLSDQEQRILQLLGSTSAAKTTGQIAYELRLAPHEVVRILLRLRDAGLLEKTHSGWRARGRLVDSTVPADQVPGQRAQASGQCRSKNDQEPKERIRDDPAPDINPASRWRDFRRLCLYYAECIRIEERARVSSYADQEGKDYISLPGPLHWRLLDSEQPIRVPAQPSWEFFFRQHRRRGCGLTFYIGAPVDVLAGKSKSTGEEYRIVSPVFVMPVVASMREGWLNLQPTSTIEINHGWLESRISKALSAPV